MKGVKFTLKGRVAHFLQASYSVYWATYPVPPRTVLQGIVGAVLGMDRDTPQIKLKDAQFAVMGATPTIHMHSGNLRKNPMPTIANSYTIPPHPKPLKPTPFNVQVTQIRQEWLYKPNYTVFAHLPDEFHDEFVRRLKTQEFYYTPYLGKTGMFATLEFLSEGEFSQLPEGRHDVESVVRDTPDTALALTEGMALQSLMMPWSVKPDRQFTICPDPYLIQREGKPIPVRTSDAHQFDNQTIMFL